MSDRIKLAFCWLVGFGWLANLGAAMYPGSTYHPDLVVNGPMLVVLGAVFQTRKKKDRDRDRGD